MIELYEFCQLDSNEQAELVWQDGTFILNLKEERYSYSLYSFFGYFVEMKLSNTANKITGIIGFRKGKRLDKYLDCIDISSI